MWKVGIIAEGEGDTAVLKNILNGLAGIQEYQIKQFVPEDDVDDTDSNYPKGAKSTGWTIVKKKCQDKDFLENCFDVLDNERFMVINIDAAERFDIGYDVDLPTREKREGYVEEVRAAVKGRILSWLPSDYHSDCTFAIAVEETEAWILTLWGDDDETGHLPKPKERLNKIINQKMSDKDRKQHFSSSVSSQNRNLSKPFRKQKELQQSRLRNKSLDLFCVEIESRN
jgi:hypothetical protein